MLNRVTIMLDDELMKKLRATQANLIKQSGTSVSLSRVINDTLRGRLQRKKR